MLTYKQMSTREGTRKMVFFYAKIISFVSNNVYYLIMINLILFLRGYIPNFSFIIMCENIEHVFFKLS